MSRLTVDQARRSRCSLLDALDAMHVLGVGCPVFFDAWRWRFAADVSEEAAAKRWERFKRWVRAAHLPVRWVTEEREGAAIVGVVFEAEARALVVGLLDDLAAQSEAAQERERERHRERSRERMRKKREREARLDALVRGEA